LVIFFIKLNIHGKADSPFLGPGNLWSDPYWHLKALPGNPLFPDFQVSYLDISIYIFRRAVSHYIIEDPHYL
jgi:hypothetical protein